MLVKLTNLDTMIDVILELTDVKFKQATIDGFTDEEVEEILDFVCTS